MAERHRALEWLARRHAGESPALIAHRAGVSTSTVVTATRAYGPFPRATQRFNAAPLPSGNALAARTARWVGMRRRGVTSVTIARREGLSHQTVSRYTAEYGPFPSQDIVDEWAAARRSGRSLRQIAEAYDVQPAKIASATRPYGPFPSIGPRLPDGVLAVSSIARIVGLNRVTVLRWRNLGRLPPPDFVTARGRALWLHTTIEKWLAEQRCLTPCPACGALCLSVTQHASRSHGPGGSGAVEPGS